MSEALILGRHYAVLHAHEWHIARWDGEAFAVESLWQSGDRWFPEWVDAHVLLPDDREDADG